MFCLPRELRETYRGLFFQKSKIQGLAHGAHSEAHKEESKHVFSLSLPHHSLPKFCAASLLRPPAPLFFFEKMHLHFLLLPPLPSRFSPDATPRAEKKCNASTVSDSKAYPSTQNCEAHTFFAHFFAISLDLALLPGNQNTSAPQKAYSSHVTFAFFAASDAERVSQKRRRGGFPRLALLPGRAEKGKMVAGETRVVFPSSSHAGALFPPPSSPLSPLGDIFIPPSRSLSSAHPPLSQRPILASPPLYDFFSAGAAHCYCAACVNQDGYGMRGGKKEKETLA